MSVSCYHILLPPRFLGFLGGCLVFYNGMSQRLNWGLYSTKNKTMAPLHVAELPKYEGSLPYLCTKNGTMAPLRVDTPTVQRELPKYEIIFSI